MEISRVLPVKAFSANEHGLHVDTQSRFCPECGVALAPRFRFSAFLAVMLVLFGMPVLAAFGASIFWALVPVIVWWLFYDYVINNGDEPFSVDKRFNQSDEVSLEKPLD